MFPDSSLPPERERGKDSWEAEFLKLLFQEPHGEAGLD